MPITVNYTIEELLPYIDWIYFFHAWGMEPRYATIASLHQCTACRGGWLASFPEGNQTKAREAISLYDQATEWLTSHALEMWGKGICRIAEANSDGDDIMIEGNRLPLLRQQHAGKKGFTLCLSDFIRPANSGIKDKIGIFATTVAPEMLQCDANDAYEQLLRQTLADRIAEATAERLHEEVRRIYWGYARDEKLSPSEILQGKYQGIRPAVGYPSLPDQSINFLLNEWVDMNRIGIRLSSTGAMIPAASVSGLMIAHPQATYFGIGAIGDDQLTEYARRRHMNTEELRRFIP